MAPGNTSPLDDSAMTLEKALLHPNRNCGVGFLTQRKMGSGPVVWIDRWFASSAADLMDLVREGFPDATLLYSHPAPSVSARRSADRCFTRVGDGSVEAMLEFAVVHGVDVLIPVRKVKGLLQSRSAFSAKDIALALPTHDVKVAQALGNKAETYSECEAFGLAPTPKWTVANSPEALLRAVRAWTEDGVTCCFKPATGEGARGFRVVDPKWSPASGFFDWPSDRLASEDVERILESIDLIPQMLVSDYLPGFETSIDVASVDGEPILCVAREKRSATEQRVIIDAEMLHAVREMSRHWQLHGCWNAQFKKTSDGQPKLLEINPRLAAGSLYAAKAEINFPALSVSIALGLTPTIGERSPAGLFRRHESVVWEHA